MTRDACPECGHDGYDGHDMRDSPPTCLTPDCDCGLDDELVSRCPACGDPIDYCPGHGEIGDPAGRAILDAHDDGDHSQCHPEGCAYSLR